jgi:hypothetical protein
MTNIKKKIGADLNPNKNIFGEDPDLYICHIYICHIYWDAILNYQFQIVNFLQAEIWILWDWYCL